jgi:hypothetical protein
MAGDYTRFTHDPRRRFSGVLMQQGRVQLDADWNEAVEIVQRSVRTLALDTFGRVGLPLLTTPDAFLIGFVPGPPPDLSIGPGRLYVDGLLAELFPEETVSYLAQPFLPDPPPLPASGGAVVYLDVWQREVTWVEEPRLLDVALGGADTSTRTQTVWQVRVEARDGAACGMPVGEPPSAGRLSTEAIAPPTPDDPCILPPLAGYRGLENRLYRVEIHSGGALGAARFKWSRDDGSIVSPVRELAVAGSQTTLTVDRIGRDPVLRFRIDDWVTVTDDHRELHGEPGEMARVIDVDEARGELVLDRALPSAGGRAFGATANDLTARHTRVQRWDQTAATNTIDADGLVTTAAGPIDLEDGIRVRFDVDPAGGAFRVGDYWVFAARTADASVEILQQAPPRGIVHHYVQLAAVTGLGGTSPQVSDCRPRPQEGTECCCCLVTVGAREDQRADFTDLGGAIAALPNLAPDESRHVIVCLLEGDHQLRGPVVVTRPRVTIRGCGWGTRLLPREGPALVLEGPEQALEDVWILAEQKAALVEVVGVDKRIERCRLEHQGSEPALRAQKAEELIVRRNLILARGGVELAGTRMTVEENRLVGGPVEVQAPSDTVRITDNDLFEARTDAIVLAGRGLVFDVDVERNRIRRARRHGIAAGTFQTDDPREGGLVAGLRITGNEIVECIDPAATRESGGLPACGIALTRVYDLLVRDNRIERNGEEAVGPVCGIYVRHSRGVAISRNVIRANGRLPDGERFPGPQAAVRLEDARITVVPVPDPEQPERQVADVDVLPAARIDGNLLEARRGHALWIRGEGPMVVEGNRFEAMDVLGDRRDTGFSTIDQFVGTVFLFNAGRPAYLAGFLAGAGMAALGAAGPTKLSGSPVLEALTVGGQTQFRGNQARLDLARLENDVVFANVCIASLDDTLIAHNQTEGVLAGRVAPAGTTTNAPQLVGDLLLADLLNLGLTTRQAANGLMSTPLLTMFSILSLGFVNHCVDNQTTSCIRAVGLSPKSVVRDNAVLFPNPRFCPEND